MTNKKRDLVKKKPVPPVTSPPLLDDLRRMIEETRQGVAATVNAAISVLYWNVGRRIREDILQKKRAEYGRQVLPTLSAKLTVEYGRGWSEKHLRHCLRFAESFPDEQIVSALQRQLSWTHLKALIYLDDPLKRDFYAEMCRIEGWSTRTLEKKIGSMLYERTALSRKPEKLIEQELAALRDTDKLTPDLVFRDPYFLFTAQRGAARETPQSHRQRPQTLGESGRGADCGECGEVVGGGVMRNYCNTSLSRWEKDRLSYRRYDN